MPTVTEAGTWRPEGTVKVRIGNIFGDTVVSATDLARQARAILDIALKAPVTITRNDQHFALMRRDLAARMSAVVEQAAEFTAAMQALHTAQNGGLSEDHPFAWLKVFTPEDLNEMGRELVDALATVERGSDLKAVTSAVYEWRASAMAIANGVLDEDDSDSEPVPLTPPEDLTAEV